MTTAMPDGLEPDTAVMPDQPPRHRLPTLRLMQLPLVDESVWTFLLSFLAVLAVTAGFYFVLHHYEAHGPGDIGVDENAYLVGGQLMAMHGTPALRPSSPFAYVGPMWILAADGSYAPKYPVGVPLLNAIAIRIGGTPMAAYWVSPICGVVSVLAMFFCTRAIAGSVCGVLASILLACNPSVQHFALVPSSHAPDLAFIIIGMSALLYWLKSGRAILGIIAGLCIGFTVSLRYSEGLLLLPLGVAALMTVRFRDRRSLLAAAVPVIAWCVPFFTLLIFNRITMGHWTGYDTTNESTGFSAHDFAIKWQYTIQQLYIYGLFFILPIGLLGMCVMLTLPRWWKPGLILLCWFAPSTLLYIAYYWGLQTPGLMYLRFFVTIYPAVIVAALWLVSMVVRGIAAATYSPTPDADFVFPRRPAIGLYIGAAFFTLIIAAEGLFVARDDLHRLHDLNALVDSSGQAILAAIPSARPGSTAPAPLLFGEDIGLFSRQLMHFQYVARGEWFSTAAFTPHGGRLAMMFGGGGGTNDRNNAVPVLIQKDRLLKIGKLYRETDRQQLMKLEAETITAALKAGREVCAVITPVSAPEFQSRLSDEGFETTVLSTWHDANSIPMTPVPPPHLTKAATSPGVLPPTTNGSPTEKGFVARFFADKDRPPPPPAGPFGGSNQTLTLPAIVIPRMFDTAADLQILKINAKAAAS